MSVNVLPESSFFSLCLAGLWSGLGNAARWPGSESTRLSQTESGRQLTTAEQLWARVWNAAHAVSASFSFHQPYTQVVKNNQQGSVSAEVHHYSGLAMCRAEKIQLQEPILCIKSEDRNSLRGKNSSDLFLSFSLKFCCSLHNIVLIGRTAVFPNDAFRDNRAVDGELQRISTAAEKSLPLKSASFTLRRVEPHISAVWRLFKDSRFCSRKS